jgi:hypothetical protein
MLPESLKKELDFSISRKTKIFIEKTSVSDIIFFSDRTTLLC